MPRVHPLVGGARSATVACPPGPKGRFILGNLREFGEDRLGFLTRCAREYGDIVRIGLGYRTAFLLNHPDYIEHVLVTRHRNFIKHRFFWSRVRAVFGKGLVNSEGELWRRERRIAQPAFHKEMLERYAETMVAHTRAMLTGWKAGETRELHQDMARLTLAIAPQVLFNAELDDEVDEIQRALNVAFKEIGARLRTPVRIPDFVPTPGNLRYRRVVRQLDDIVYRIIAERRGACADAGADLLGLLLQARYEHGQPLPEKQIRDELVTFLIAGHETTALLLSWTWYLLMGHPEVERRLVTELHQVLGHREPVAGDCERLVYAKQILKEALRLYPPAFMVGREALQDCEIAGYRIPAGATLFMSPWVTHRDPRYFERPDELIPERWANGLTRSLPRFAYFPFGGGPRVCIGNEFAMMEAVLILATITRRFRFTLVPGSSVTPSASLTLRPAAGVPVILERR